jgi:hypothetical protein
MKFGPFGQSPSFFTNVADTKIHQNFCFDEAVEMARSKMSNSSGSPSSFGVQKRPPKSHKMSHVDHNTRFSGFGLKY